MDENKLKLHKNKYKLPYHWIRDPLHRDSLPYFGYVQVVLDELPSPPATILDAGCGDGRIAAEMIRQGYTVTGLDYLETSVLYAQALVPDGVFFVADLREDLTAGNLLQEEEFDAVVLVEVYEHIPPEDCPRVLENLYNVLRAGGILVISAPSNLLPPSNLHYRHFVQDELVEELRAASFIIRKLVYQHRIDRLAIWQWGGPIEKLLDNRWLQPIFLKRLRRYLYMKYGNIGDGAGHCGRFIAVAQR